LTLGAFQIDGAVAPIRDGWAGRQVIPIFCNGSLDRCQDMFATNFPLVTLSMTVVLVNLNYNLVGFLTTKPSIGPTRSPAVARSPLAHLARCPTPNCMT